MGFRDDREASSQRIETLERAVATLSKELESASKRAAEVDPLHKQLLETTRERDALHGEVSPKWEAQQQRVMAFAIAGVVVAVLVGVLAYRMRTSELDTVRTAAAACHADQIECEHDSAALIRQRDVAVEAHAAASAELARTRSPLATRARRGILVRARVATAEGDGAHVGDTCTLVATVLDGVGQCAATMTCGSSTILFGQYTQHVDCTLDRAASTPPVRTTITGVSVPPQALGAAGIGALGALGGLAGHGASLATLRGTEGALDPILVYDADAHTIEVQRVLPDRIRAHLDVISVDPFLFQ